MRLNAGLPPIEARNRDFQQAVRAAAESTGAVGVVAFVLWPDMNGGTFLAGRGDPAEKLLRAINTRVQAAVEEVFEAFEDPGQRHDA